VERDTFVAAMDLSGKRLWRKEAGEAWQPSERQRWAVRYDGSRATPTVDGETVYYLSELGWLNAFEAATGKLRWRRDVLKDFHARRPKYGYAESVLVLGDRVFCSPAGRKGQIVALDKTTGKTLWANRDLHDGVGYCSPVVAEINGVRQLVVLSESYLFAVRVDNGKLLWKQPFGNKRRNNATDPIVHDGLVYASSGYGRGSIVVRPTQAEDGSFSVEVVWKSDLLDNHHGGVLRVDGHLYGSGHEAMGWFCLRLTDGKQMWRQRGKGSLTFAEGRLYLLDEGGEMSLVKATADKWLPISSFKVPRGGRGAFWAHPVVCGKRLYVRHSEKLYAYDIAAADER
jgi:outer membrane protein assembly factor BamB